MVAHPRSVAFLWFFIYLHHERPNNANKRVFHSAFISLLEVFGIVQSTLVISNPKGLSKILRDIRTSTYQICRLEEKINRTTAFNKCRCNWTLEVRHMLKILWKRGEIAPLEQFLLFSTIFCYLLLDFHF